MTKISPTLNNIIFNLLFCIFSFLVTVSISHAEEDNGSTVKFSVIEIDDDGIETFDATSSNSLFKRFKSTNSNIQVHELQKTTDDYAEDTTNPALRLDRVHVGENSTLLEIVGLKRQGGLPSAIIRSDTFGIREKNGSFHKSLSHGGVKELRDKKGGVALVVNPGDRLFVLTESVDDFYPFSIEHTSWQGDTFTYFDNIDPRFKERYLKHYKEAVTPEKMKDFIVDYSNNDPDKKVREVFVGLIGKMRQKNTFEGYYNAYLLMQDPQDASKALSLARTAEHKAMMEHIAVATLRDKGRLIHFDLKLDSTHTKDVTGSCFMFCNYNFTAYRMISGTLKAHVKPKSPIKLRYGTYKAIFVISGLLPRYKETRSNWIGNTSKQSNDTFKKEVSIILSPPNYSANLVSTFGDFNIAFFQRGSAGGYTAMWANGDGRVSVTLKNLELQK